jgi:hypothetical protein
MSISNCAATRLSTYAVPETGFLRLKQIIGNPKANPAIPGLIPISASAWWQGVNSGRYPQAIKLSPGVTVWRAEDIHSLIRSYDA